MDQFLRTRTLLGNDAIAKLNNTKVMIVGIGAVGSFCLEAISRAGIGNIVLIDHDKVEHSNLNRQIIALHSTINKYKTHIASERTKDINPNINISTNEIFVDQNNIDQLLDEHKPDIVVDAIDSFDSKLELIYKSVTRKQKIFSSMGAGRKVDPTQIKIDDISKVSVCPLGKKIKKNLKLKNVHKGFKCVYSVEPAFKQTAYNNEKVGKQPIGSLPTVTGIFGLLLANLVITESI